MYVSTRLPIFTYTVIRPIFGTLCTTYVLSFTLNVIYRYLKALANILYLHNNNNNNKTLTEPNNISRV